MKTIFIILILFISLYSNELNDIRQIQKDFYNNVVLGNLKSYYSGDELKKHIKIHKKRAIFSQDSKKNIVKMLFSKIQDENITQDEYFSITNLKKQFYTIILYSYNLHKLYIIGSDYISSGDMRLEQKVKKGEDHFFNTPAGVYEVKMGWRSDGKISLNGKVKSYGTKDNFVYYFGKVNAKRYNSFKPNGKKIKDIKKYKIIDDKLNFAIHTHISNLKIGYRVSHGCVRLTERLNLFLEHNLVLHKNFYKDNRWILKNVSAPKNIKNIDIKGRYVFIVDSI